MNLAVSEKSLSSSGGSISERYDMVSSSSNRSSLGKLGSMVIMNNTEMALCSSVQREKEERKMGNSFIEFV